MPQSGSATLIAVVQRCTKHVCTPIHNQKECVGTWVNVPLYHNNVSVALMLVSSQQSEEKVFPATCLLYWIVPKCPNPRPMNFKGASLSTLIQPNFPTKFFQCSISNHLFNTLSLFIILRLFLPTEILYISVHAAPHAAVDRRRTVFS